MKDGRSMQADNMAAPDRDFRLLDLLAVVLRHWKRILAVTAATTVVALASTLLRRASYGASTVVVPSSGGQSRMQLGNLPAGVAGLIGVGGPTGNERLVGVILQSRTLEDSVVRRTARTREQEGVVRKVVKKGTRVQRNPDGSILIQVRARDPRLAARVANAYPLVLNRILTQLSADAAQRKQGFLAVQLTAARDRLTESEQRMLEFQQRRSAPDLTQQAVRTMEAAATLQEAVFAQERAVAQLRRTGTAQNPQLLAAEAELATRRAQLRRLQSGSGGNSVFLPIGEGPELRVASTRLLREFAKDEQVYQSLTAALAEAQIDANNNLPVLSVLDAATVPEHPIRSLKTALVLAPALGLFLAFAAEALHRVRRTPQNERFFAAWDQFKRDLFGSRRRATVTAGD